jgi:hypothetical protein
VCCLVGCTKTDYNISKVTVSAWDYTDENQVFELNGISAKVLEETEYREVPGCVDEVIFAVPNEAEFLEAVQNQTNYSHKEISVKNEDVYVFRDGNSRYYLYNSSDSKRWGSKTVYTLSNNCSWIDGGGDTVYYFPLIDFRSRHNGRVDIGAGTTVSMDWEALKAYYTAMDSDFYEIDDAQRMIYLKAAVQDGQKGEIVMAKDHTVRLEHKTINDEHYIYAKVFFEKN